LFKNQKSFDRLIKLHESDEEGFRKEASAKTLKELEVSKVSTPNNVLQSGICS